jgi:hypothetical protein
MQQRAARGRKRACVSTGLRGVALPAVGAVAPVSVAPLARVLRVEWWCDGVMKEWWSGGVWYDGVWCDGVMVCGVWCDGVWCDGVMV